MYWCLYLEPLEPLLDHFEPASTSNLQPLYLNMYMYRLSACIWNTQALPCRCLPIRALSAWQHAWSLLLDLQQPLRPCRLCTCICTCIHCLQPFQRWPSLGRGPLRACPSDPSAVPPTMPRSPEAFAAPAAAATPVDLQQQPHGWLICRADGLSDGLSEPVPDSSGSSSAWCWTCSCTWRGFWT